MRRGLLAALRAQGLPDALLPATDADSGYDGGAGAVGSTGCGGHDRSAEHGG